MSIFADRYASFFDPFADGNVVEKSDVFRDALSSVHVDAPPPYQPNLKGILTVVSAEAVDHKSSDAIQYVATTDMAIHGQGTVIASCTMPTRLLFTFNTDGGDRALYVAVYESSVEFGYGPAAPPGSNGFLPERVTIEGSVVGDSVDSGLAPTFLRPTLQYPARYWLSVDHKNGILRFGRDYANLTLTLYAAELKKRVDPGVLHWKDDNYEFIDKLTTVTVQQLGGDLQSPPLQVVYQPLPVVEKLPPIIVPNERITLDVLAKGCATVPANLSDECQRLYANVAGANIMLDTADFPDFSQAIERSVNSEGLLCQKLLQKKSGEFGEDNYKTTYLRITLGADLGNSPGPPYVLEIWPAMHASPIHNHGDSHAVIKVLHGKIKAYYFTSLHDAHPIGPPANLEKGDITWIDPENYQVHQLSNENRDGSVCCTIQCYSYGAKDTRHYECFDYINKKTSKVIEHFEPNSDMRFDEFKAALKQEWESRWDKRYDGRVQ
ncbi:unnamed protein product [Peniophora sp. CBMAI 1063]|nr:unnamed protein product [Peniophora sp. CBMAI 1063]